LPSTILNPLLSKNIFDLLNLFGHSCVIGDEGEKIPIESPGFNFLHNSFYILRQLIHFLLHINIQIYIKPYSWYNILSFNSSAFSSPNKYLTISIAKLTAKKGPLEVIIFPSLTTLSSL